MKFLIINTLLLFSIFSLAGCSQQSLATKENETPIQAKEEQQTTIYYNSVGDYSESITGEHLKTGILEVSKEKNIIHFKIKVAISSDLQTKIHNTKENFYFNITDVEGKNNLASVLAEPPLFTPCNLNEMREGNYYVIKQSVTVKKDISSEKLKKLLLPSNYELQFVAKDKQVAAIIIGLETNMIN